MLSNFFVALSGVVPLFCLMAVGVFIKRSRLLTEEELLHVNRMVFQVFFFFMMFYNIYVSDPGTAFQPKLMLFGAGGVLLTALVFGIIVCRIEADNARRGPMIQAIFRSNFVLMGIPLISNILALIILGASFRGGSFRKHLCQLVFCLGSRLILVPAIMLTLAIALGFRGVELVTLVAIFATPCAVAGFAMAQQMRADAELAGNCVVYSSALSCFTIFGWVFLLKTLELF